MPRRKKDAADAPTREPLTQVNVKLYTADVEQARRLAEGDGVHYHAKLRAAVRRGLRAKTEVL